MSELLKKIEKRGYTLKKEFHPFYAEVKCYNCGNTDIKRDPNSEPWTSEYNCNKCNYLTFIIRGDKMGGQGDTALLLNKKE